MNNRLELAHRVDERWAAGRHSTPSRCVSPSLSERLPSTQGIPEVVPCPDRVSEGMQTGPNPDEHVFRSPDGLGQVGTAQSPLALDQEVTKTLVAKSPDVACSWHISFKVEK
jgi:hypothetical protein